MALSISIAVLLGVAVFVAMRVRALPLGTGTLAILFGVYLGNTGAGGPINDGMTAIANVIAGINV